MKTAKKTLIKYITVACQTDILLDFPDVEVTETEEDIGTKFQYLLSGLFETEGNTIKCFMYSCKFHWSYNCPYTDSTSNNQDGS